MELKISWLPILLRHALKDSMEFKTSRLPASRLSLTELKAVAVRCKVVVVVVVVVLLLLLLRLLLLFGLVLKISLLIRALEE